MTMLWMILAFWLGTMVGFGLFAALQVSRETEDSPLDVPERYRFSAGC